MASETKATFEGRWRQLVNLSADRKGSIHDDEQAQKMGFRGGFVPGSTVATAAMPAVVKLLGKQWFEGGWYTFNFIAPVYVDEEVREVAETEGAEAMIKVVARDDRLCCVGRAGLGFQPAWDAARDGQRGAEGVFPEIAIGREVGTIDFNTAPDEVRAMIDSAGDATPWYKAASPWGGAILPPEWLHRVALQLGRQLDGAEKLPITGVREPSMWAEHAVAFAQPLFAGKPYRLREWVADKGVSGRTLFITYEFAVTEGDKTVAIGRHKVKWFAAE